MKVDPCIVHFPVKFLNPWGNIAISRKTHQKTPLSLSFLRSGFTAGTITTNTTQGKKFQLYPTWKRYEGHFFLMLFFLKSLALKRNLQMIIYQTAGIELQHPGCEPERQRKYWLKWSIRTAWESRGDMFSVAFRQQVQRACLSTMHPQPSHVQK